VLDDRRPPLRPFSAFLAINVVADEETQRRVLPIELSSVVATLVVIARELTKNLNRDEATEVIAHLCDELRALPDEKRGPNRPFTR